jgi:transcriptional regulator with XRE-family HTH domain
MSAEEEVGDNDMSEVIAPAVSRLKLGRLLRDYRVQAGLTLRQVGIDIDSSEATLSRIERGDAPSHPSLVKAMLELYEVPRDNWEGMLMLARESKAGAWRHHHRLPAHGVQALESQASLVRVCEVSLVPSLLHTTEYLAAVHARDRQLGKLVALHTSNQDRLTVARSVRMHAIIDEAVLCRPVGGVSVLVRQLVHLVELAMLPNVTVQVLPMRIGMSPALYGGFRVLGFPAGTIDDVAYVDNAAGGVQVIKKSTIASLSRQFRVLSETALPPNASVDVIAYRANNPPRDNHKSR